MAFEIKYGDVHSVMGYALSLDSLPQLWGGAYKITFAASRKELPT